jgi:Skp family chaperone for outer membrane proteins
MKKIIFLSLILIMSCFSGIAQSQKKGNAAQSTIKVEAFYFHNTSRCVTCKAVEAEAKADLESLYGKQVTFTALNLEEETTNPIAEKLKVSGQTLLVVKGDKQINLTNEGFLYARTNPAKFKKIIKENVDKLLEL